LTYREKSDERLTGVNAAPFLPIPHPRARLTPIWGIVFNAQLYDF